MLFVTDRKPAGKDNPEFYQNVRGSGLISGQGEIISTQKKDGSEKAGTNEIMLEVTGIKEFGVLSSALPYGVLTDMSEFGDMPVADKVFADTINKKLAISGQKDIFLYVHGYKVAFENPLLVSSELWHYLGYDGVFIAYAWPSTPKRLAYFKDIETAQLTGHNLRLLLEYLAKQTDAERIHIIAYSAGTRAAITALHQLALTHSEHSKESNNNKLRIGQVVLAASDYDKQAFAAAIADGLLNVPEVIAIYMSGSDDALGISHLIFQGERLGEFAQMKETISPTVRSYFDESGGLFFINATNAEKSSIGNGHAYFLNSPWVSSDLLMSLKYGLSPKERGLLRKENDLQWYFPPDYIAKLLNC